MNILVVEDEPIIAIDLQDRLQDAGYSVRQTDRGEKVLAVLADWTVNLALLDINLAGAMDGVATARLIQQHHNCPIIFLTSNADDPTFNRARATRPAAFLTKPFRGRDLLHAVSLALDAEDPAAASQRTPVSDGDQIILVKDGNETIRIDSADILCINADDYYCRLVTKDRDILITKTMKRFVADLPGSLGLLRVHRSHIINPANVTSLGTDYVMLGEVRVPVSRSKKEEVIKSLR